MKLLHNSWAVTSILVAIAFAAVTFLLVKPVLAQVATSSAMDATSSATTPTVDASVNTTPPAFEVMSAATSTGASAATSLTAPASTAPPIEAAPQGLNEAHIIGTKYIDYFTDGTTVTAYPGDPEVDSHFNKSNAPIPTHAGLTWDHTTGRHLYDTASGDLEVGQYALQANGSYIANAPPFVSSTSTPAVLGESTSASLTSSDKSTTSITTADPAAPTTASSDSTTTSSNQ
jgi:hypothetical protein